MNNCNNEGTNHAITVFGYEESGNWIIKNSWGTSWGEDGFIRLAPGNTCAVMSNSWLPA
jgi:C1A family cysteine protease